MWKTFSLFVGLALASEYSESLSRVAENLSNISDIRDNIYHPKSTPKKVTLTNEVFSIFSYHQVRYGYRFCEFEKSCKESNIDELFARKLIINGKDYGPAYYRASPIFVGKKSEPWGMVYVVPSLDFGTIDRYSGLDPGDKEAVDCMKASLVTSEIFMTKTNVLVQQVMVNGMDYGEKFIRSKMELSDHRTV